MGSTEGKATYQLHLYQWQNPRLCQIFTGIIFSLTSHVQSEFFCHNRIIIFSIKYIYPRLVLMVAEL